MNWNNIIHTIIFLSLTGPGIVGNMLIFIRHIYMPALGTEKKPVDLIVIHLAFSNMITICTTGIKDIATVFYFRNFLGDIGCKAVVYLARMARGLSICTTCPLVWSRLSPSVPGPPFGQSSNHRHHRKFFPFSSSFGLLMFS